MLFEPCPFLATTTTKGHAAGMALSTLGNYLLLSLSFVYGVSVFCSYAVIAVWRGTFFRRPMEKEKLELELARDRFWNLSKEWQWFSHHFLTLKNGFKFHYVSNQSPEAAGSDNSDEPLVIFLHGFPDSWAIWRHVLASPVIREGSTVVAVDLPGYGGSGSLQKYGATEIMEALMEFIIRVREDYGVDSQENDRRKKVIIVGYDWGAVFAFRLAGEAPQLADRFIATNGPLVPLMQSNIYRRFESSAKMFMTFLRKPWHSRSTLLNSVLALKPALRQVILSGYIFVFQLPLPFVRILGSGGNYSFLKRIHEQAAGPVDNFSIKDAEESMASTLGPGVEELKTKTPAGEGYPESVRERHKTGNFIPTTSYYRDGAATGSWHKSLETISALHNIWPDRPRRTSSGGVFDVDKSGALQACATVVWGKLDSALDSHLALEGMGDYLIHGSHVIVLPRAGHFLPMEEEGRAALRKVVEWAVGGEKGDILAAVRAEYPDAAMVIRK